MTATIELATLARRTMAVRIKGQAFIGFLSTLHRLYGEATHEKVRGRFSPELTAALKSGEIVPMGWYPLEWYASLHAAARTVCGDHVSTEVGREAARSDLNTIYRFILKLVSPEALLKQSSKVFGLFCEGGKCTVDSARAGQARIRYADCPGAPRGMWDVVRTTTELMVELCGGRNVIGATVDGGGDGDAGMLVEVRWSAR